MNGSTQSIRKLFLLRRCDRDNIEFRRLCNKRSANYGKKHGIDEDYVKAKRTRRYIKGSGYSGAKQYPVVFVAG